LTFEVIPAIDLRAGRCVRLFQGDYARETQYSDDPVAVARRWRDLGAPRLHVVDLDGARDGAPVNAHIMAAICRELDIGVEVSGGLRTMESIDAAVAYGAGRIQLGSAAVRDPELVRQAVARYPGRIVVSIDARDGEVVTDGWLKGTGRGVLQLAAVMIEAGVPRIMFTDVGRDSTLTEPNFDVLAALVRELPVPVVASGGVAHVDHLRRLAGIGCEGAVVGKALYEGWIELPEALTAVATV